MKLPLMNVRNGFNCVGLGVMLFLVGLSAVPTGTREKLFLEAVSIAVMLAALVLVTYGIVQVLMTWGRNSKDNR